jgi:uncharacterized protein
MTPEAFFVSASQGRGGHRFCLYYPVPGPVARGAIVYVHPFADEMNKARRMASLQSRRMCEAGYAVLQMDLLGCGDSSGDFGDATWEDWIEDVHFACRWLCERTDAPLWLWGMRAGCLLAVEAAATLELDKTRFLFWQPAGLGKQVLQQFLRFKAAADLSEGNAKAVMAELRAQLAEGAAVDVVGYRLSAGLAAGLERAQLGPPQNADRLEWFEVSSRATAGLAPSAERYLEAWRESGVDVHASIVNGPAFWQTTDIEEAPELLDATMRALLEPERQVA